MASKQDHSGRNARLARAYSITDANDSNTVYRDWAKHYDSDLLGKGDSGGLGYSAPWKVVERFVDFVSDPAAIICDAAAGTGLVGEALVDKGFKTIDAFDLSPEMLEVAGEKGVYRNLVQRDLNENYGCDGAYDALVSVGMFSYGWGLPKGIVHCFTPVKAGGIVCFTVNQLAYEERPFQAAIDAVLESGVAEQLTFEDCNYIEKESITCKLGVFKRL